jgi:hypothetical protein
MLGQIFTMDNLRKRVIIGVNLMGSMWIIFFYTALLLGSYGVYCYAYLVLVR